MGFSIGAAVNSITGATNSAQRAQDYAVHMAELNNRYQKEFAQNAHQWEVEDLKKAGLNPILSAGGSGASASGGGAGGVGAVNSAITPIDLLNTAISAKKTLADTKVSEETAGLTREQSNLAHAQAIKTALESDLIDKQQRKKLEAEYYNILADTEMKKGQWQNALGSIRQKGAKKTAKDVLNWFTK